MLSFWFPSLSRQLNRIERKLDALKEQGELIVSLQDDAIAAAQAEGTVIDSVLALLTELRNNPNTDAKTQQILDQIMSNRTKLETALTTTSSGDPAPVS